VINGEAAADWSGLSVSSAGDVNGDGLDDLIVGAEGANPSGRSNSGKSYVVFGKIGSSAIDLSTIADKIYLQMICHLDQRHQHPQSNHPSRRR
jgi:hypothetical protein